MGHLEYCVLSHINPMIPGWALKVFSRYKMRKNVPILPIHTRFNCFQELFSNQPRENFLTLTYRNSTSIFLSTEIIILISLIRNGDDGGLIPSPGNILSKNYEKHTAKFLQAASPFL